MTFLFKKLKCSSTHTHLFYQFYSKPMLQHILLHWPIKHFELRFSDGLFESYKFNNNNYFPIVTPHPTPPSLTPDWNEEQGGADAGWSAVEPLLAVLASSNDHTQTLDKHSLSAWACRGGLEENSLWYDVWLQKKKTLWWLHTRQNFYSATIRLLQKFWKERMTV